MSKVKSFMYYIEYKNGNQEIMDKSTLETEVDNNFDKFFKSVGKIEKKYKLHDGFNLYNCFKKKICLTLFTMDYTFSPYEYIEHYRGLPKEVYGVDFLSDFDIEMITMFN
jgi:hypothetical protein